MRGRSSTGIGSRKLRNRSINIGTESFRATAMDKTPVEISITSRESDQRLLKVEEYIPNSGFLYFQAHLAHQRVGFIIFSLSRARLCLSVTRHCRLYLKLDAAGSALARPAPHADSTARAQLRSPPVCSFAELRFQGFDLYWIVLLTDISIFMVIEMGLVIIVELLAPVAVANLISTCSVLDWF
ncbi:hypothetical protein PanWU01x14_031560 [Parasponia andersonii]|uniref:Uncharacterized protein n=1 Tax=Parasponia andersonii TaxID=3476 RepID=A0A2P5DU75_PARAD|nr:hypothetical protein PanWU01x14_031560 [Parasponia andersonii]